MLDIDSVIKDGVKHIASKQRRAGDFASLSSFNPADFTGAISYSTTFFTANILGCLNTVASDRKYCRRVDPIRARAATFLLREKSAGWSFNYWSRDAQERTSMPYPDDIDDTFCALAALMQYDHTIIDGEALAAIVAILTGVEIQEGGPYRTWLVATHGGKWADVDLVANSNVGHFLALAGVHLPNLERLVDDDVSRGALRSPYYPGAAHVLYFISRFYKSRNDPGSPAAAQNIIAAVLAFRKASSASMTPLESAMTITALINLGAVETIDRNDVEKLLVKVKREGWKPYAFCIDPARAGATSYAGASALTAVVCLEMAVLYNNARENNARERRESELAKNERAERHKKIVAEAKIRLDNQSGIDAALRAIIIQKINAIADEKITLLAQDFRQALGIMGAEIQDGTVDRLALGNLYGWIAYDIYDDILDGEGDPLLLGAANVCLRTLTHIYEIEEIATPGSLEFFNRIMNTIDSANTWEQEHCKLPAAKDSPPPTHLPDFVDYGTLADRSIGHAMGPLVELMIAGHDHGSPAFKNILAMFRHYLIARQLHDDAHDWADDLLRGRVNSAGALVIKNFRARRPGNIGASIKDALPVLREIFWKDTVGEVVALIHHHIDAARAAREKSGVIDKTDFLETALTSLEAGAKKALTERDAALVFLKHYRPTGIPCSSRSKPPENEISPPVSP